MAIHGLLLAAGESRRFHGDKLLACVAGEPMIVRAARNLLDAGLSVLCVVRDGHGRVAHLMNELGVEVCVCAHAHLGMGLSLARGVEATPCATGWLVALGDMPRILPSTIRDLVHAMESGGSLVAPRYQCRRGHPVGFASAWRNELLALSDDLGGRRILEAYPQAMQLVPVDDPGVLLDVDRPMDLSLASLR